jgi:cytochrome c551/c552
MQANTRNIGRIAILGMTAAAALLVGGQAFAAMDESDLAQKSGCLACHAGVAERVGPPYKNVAEKYAGQKGAAALLAERIVKGTGPAGQGWMKAGKASLPFMPANVDVTPTNALKLATWVLGVSTEIVDNSKFVTESIAVSGLVAHPLKLSVDDLKKFSVQQASEVPVVCLSGADRGKLTSPKGVLLRDILTKASIVTKNHDGNKLVVVASASDGYRVIFSWNEIFNSPLGDDILVYFQKNGLPLGDDEGRIAMISGKDIRNGARHVKWLEKIEVRKVAD